MYFVAPIPGLLFFLVFFVGYVAVLLLVARFLVWFLTPVAYRRWKQLSEEDSRREL